MKDKVSELEMSRTIESKAVKVAIYIINECIYKGYEINHSKVQKLVFLSHVYQLQTYGVPMISQKVLYWKCGFAFEDIEKYVKDNYGVDYVTYNKKIKEKRDKDVKLMFYEEKIISLILGEYGKMTKDELIGICSDAYFEENYGKNNENEYNCIDYVDSEEIKNKFKLVRI